MSYTERRKRKEFDRRATPPPRVLNWDQIAVETRLQFKQLPWYRRVAKRTVSSGTIALMALPMAFLYAVIGLSSVQALGKQLIRVGLRLQRHGF